MAVLTDPRNGFCHTMGLPISARYKHSEEEINKAFLEVCAQHPEHDRAEAMGRALARLDALKHQKSKTTILRVSKQHDWRRWAEIAAFVVLLILVLARAGHCQGTINIRGIAKGTTVASSSTVTPVDGNHNALDVNVVAGGGTGGGPADTAASASASESDTARQKVTAAIRLLDSAQGAGTKLVTWPGDQTSGAWVNCKAGCAGGSTTPADGFANPTTAGLSATFPFVYNGTTWDRLRGDATNGAFVQVKTMPSTAVTNAGLTNLDVALSTRTKPADQQHTIIDSGTTAATQSGTWNVRAQDGAGNALTSNSTTYTAKFAIDVNMLGTLGTAFSTAGKIDVKEADGDAFVRQATAANLNVRPDTSGATGAAPPARADFAGGLGSGATGGFVIGLPVSDTYKVVNVSTATTTLLVTGVSGRQVRIGSINLLSAGANNVALIEGTGATCGTGSAGMNGGTTAASGWNFAANGGIAFGTGLGTVMQTATTGDSVCVVTSAAVQLSGGLQYTIY